MLPKGLTGEAQQRLQNSGCRPQILRVLFTVLRSEVRSRQLTLLRDRPILGAEMNMLQSPSNPSL